MKRSLLAACLALASILAMAGSASAEAYCHKPTGIIFPDIVCTLDKLEEVTDFEAKTPGLGIGVGYKGPGITATVYVYSSGLKSVPGDLDSPVIKGQFEQAAGDVVRAGEMGHYADVKRLSDDVVTWSLADGSAKSLHASFSYTQKGRERLSHLYLLGFKNHFVKVRYTYDKAVKEEAEKTRDLFLSDLSFLLYCAQAIQPEQKDQAAP